MKNLRNQKGITLVALVVTIIVLLILAGVSLSLVAGSDGILNKASSAVEKDADASVKEQAGLALTEAKADYYEDKYASDTGLPADVTDFTSYVSKNLTELNKSISGGSMTIDTTTKEVTITVTKTKKKFKALIENVASGTEGTTVGTWTEVTGNQ